MDLQLVQEEIVVSINSDFEKLHFKNVSENAKMSSTRKEDRIDRLNLCIEEINNLVIATNDTVMLRHRDQILLQLHETRDATILEFDRTNAQETIEFLRQQITDLLNEMQDAPVEVEKKNQANYEHAMKLAKVMKETIHQKEDLEVLLKVPLQ